MLAKISAEKASIYDELENCPHSMHRQSEHGRQSKNPEKRGAHNDGCGLAWFENGKLLLHKRGKDRFWDESFAKATREAKAKIFIAHDRQASGTLPPDEKGAHPFHAAIGHQPVALCHNGAVRDLMEGAKARGASDSELFLEAITAQASSAGFSDIHKVISRMAKEYDYTSLTAFLLTPEKLFAWRIYNDKDEANRERYEKYYTLHMSNRGDHVLIVSEPIDDEPNWELIPNMSFIEAVPEDEEVKITRVSLN